MSIVGEPVTATVHFVGEVAPSKVEAYINGPGILGQVFTYPTDPEVVRGADDFTYSYTFSPTKAGRFWVIMDGKDNNDQVIGTDSEFVDVEPKPPHA